MSDFSSTSLTPPSEASRPPWEPRTRFEIEREAAALRENLKALSEAVGSALDVLLHAETDPGRQAEDESRRREALECLDYVREVLGQASKGEITSLDEERLWGEELAKRKKMPENQQKVAEALVESEIAEPSITSISQPSRTADAPELSTVRKARGTTVLPINAPVERQPPNRNATPTVAPWNHTPSNFSSSSYGLSLPTRPPPTTLAPPPAARTSSGRPEILRERSSSMQQDPLGALKK
jgi:TBC1 domain family protein 5